nr:immunoglobulin heavy chain junction region [Macaca mulatta]MOV38320.1 immunoglobulin heavy chain junction region [Macaca mulatta]MOV40966.1 immunoglobulin heavy chain junction region [Macaca mulatta]MOV41972.1 immunoglobulin heavy chain junction region [Macaca mulatta]MOV42154.1 immunoglobulin heavy chain junction region [Macaca mulatta]
CARWAAADFDYW